jgi:hypothetical protein
MTSRPRHKTQPKSDSVSSDMNDLKLFLNLFDTQDWEWIN